MYETILGIMFLVIAISGCVGAAAVLIRCRGTKSNNKGTSGNQSDASRQIESARSDNQRAGELLKKAEDILNK